MTKSGAGVVVLVGTDGVLLNVDSSPMVALPPPSREAIVLRSLARSLFTLFPLLPLMFEEEDDDDDDDACDDDGDDEGDDD